MDHFKWGGRVWKGVQIENHPAVIGFPPVVIGLPAAVWLCDQVTAHRGRT